MHVLRVVGPSDTGKTTLVGRLAGRLSERGPVGTVKHVECEPDLDTAGTDTARHRAAGASRTYGVGDGEFFATGEGMGLWGALDALAPAVDYALVEGYAEAGTGLPAVALGGVEVADPVVSAPTASGVDVDGLVHAVSDGGSYETLESLVARAERTPAAAYAGAIATFTGRVRARDDPRGPATARLDVEPDGDESSTPAAVRSELAAREGICDVLVHHRTGAVEAGEAVVHVVVLAGGREVAVAGVDDAIDRLRSELSLSKTEVTVTEE